jgi:hypothetical protein
LVHISKNRTNEIILYDTGEENTKIITYQKGWRIQTNDELQIKYRKPNTVNNNRKKTRMDWSGKNF